MSASLLALLTNKIVFFDSSCFIYTYENNPAYAPVTENIFNAIGENKLQAITSVITVTEVLTKQYMDNNFPLIEKYLWVFSYHPNLSVVQPDVKIAIEAAKIRAKYGLELADSYQLACAISQNADIFLCNDKQLKKYNDLKVIILDDFVN